MKKLPKGTWTDTKLKLKCHVLYYDSRSRCYRIQYHRMSGMRVWAAVEQFAPGKRFTPPTAWDRIQETT